MVRVLIEYHLKIVSPVGNVNSERYGRKISTFLDDIFTGDCDDKGLPPLEYDAHLAIEERGYTAVLARVPNRFLSSPCFYTARR